MTNDTQVIYSMVRVGRIYPPNKQVLRDISLGFYYGAKIGVLGLNGSGKSTLLRIMAGIDQDYIGEIAMSKGYTVGILEQEPQLDESKTVIEVIPVAGTLPENQSGDYSFITGDACAVRLVPACAPLLARLREKHALEVPEEDEALLACIAEVCDDLIEVAEKTEAKRDGENIVVTLHGYRLIPGCRAIRAASPKCCTMVACPVCSLIAAIVALGKKTPVRIEHTAVDERRGVLRVILTPAGNTGSNES